MKKLLKKIFCSHSWVKLDERGFYPGLSHMQSWLAAYRGFVHYQCRRCGKIKTVSSNTVVQIDITD